MLNALGYVCGCPLPDQVLLSRRFQKSRGKAMGIAYLGIGLGGAAAPWILEVRVQRFGWQMALCGLGVLIIFIVLRAVFFVKDSVQRKGICTSAAPSRLREAFVSLRFLLLAAGSVLSIAAGSGTQQNLKLLFPSLDRHFTESRSAHVFSLVLAFSVAGRLLMGWLADRFPKKYVMLSIYLLVTAAIRLLLAGTTPAVLFAFAVVCGIGLGGDYLIVPLMTAEISELQLLGGLLGVILIAGGVAESLAPWVLGHFRDTTGSYAATFIALMGMALLSACAVLGRPKEVKAS
jgi:sugar phosphate permease